MSVSQNLGREAEKADQDYEIMLKNHRPHRENGTFRRYRFICVRRPRPADATRPSVTAIAAMADTTFLRSDESYPSTSKDIGCISEFRTERATFLFIHRYHYGHRDVARGDHWQPQIDYAGSNPFLVAI